MRAVDINVCKLHEATMMGMGEMDSVNKATNISSERPRCPTDPILGKISDRRRNHFMIVVTEKHSDI